MKPKYFSIPYIVWMAIFVIAPILLIVVFAFTTPDGAFTFGNFAEMYRFIHVFIRSFLLAFVATAICIFLGYPIALLLSREGPRLQRLMMMLIMLPLWMNFLLRTYAWMTLLSPSGIINTFLQNIGLPGFQILNTPTAVVLGMVYNFLPFMILPIYSVVVKIDRSLYEAAQDLGASGLSVVRRLVVPMSLPGLLSGVMMVFVPSVSTFIITQLLGGGMVMMLGDLIEMQFLGAAYNPQLGSAIALVMMLVVIFFMFIMNRFGGGDDSQVVRAGQ